MSSGSRQMRLNAWSTCVKIAIAVTSSTTKPIGPREEALLLTVCSARPICSLSSGDTCCSIATSSRSWASWPATVDLQRDAQAGDEHQQQRKQRQREIIRHRRRHQRAIVLR